jgi:hypothetical protein
MKCCGTRCCLTTAPTRYHTTTPLHDHTHTPCTWNFAGVAMVCASIPGQPGSNRATTLRKVCGLACLPVARQVMQPPSRGRVIWFVTSSMLLPVAMRAAAAVVWRSSSRSSAGQPSWSTDCHGACRNFLEGSAALLPVPVSRQLLGCLQAATARKCTLRHGVWVIAMAGRIPATPSPPQAVLGMEGRKGVVQPLPTLCLNMPAALAGLMGAAQVCCCGCGLQGHTVSGWGCHFLVLNRAFGRQGLKDAPTAHGWDCAAVMVGTAAQQCCAWAVAMWQPPQEGL